MKITHIITGLETGGAEHALLNILRGGLANRFDNRVVSLGGIGTIGPTIESLGIEVSPLHMRSGCPTLSNMRSLRRTIQSHDANIIQGWMYHGNLAASYAKRHVGSTTKLCWNVRHCLYGLQHEKRMTRQVIRLHRYCSPSVDAILYNSQLSKTQHEQFGFSSQCSHVIPNGIDTGRFQYSEQSKCDVRKQLGISTESVVIGHIARLHPIKDHPNFIKAATSLCQQFPETQFLCIGRDVTKERVLLEKFVPSEHQDRFHFLGEREDVPQLMNAMDIFCQSSLSEAFPNVLCEAMATAVPCVATNVGDSALILGSTGTVVPPADEAALAQGLVKLVLLTPAQRKELGSKASHNIATNYAVESIVDKYTELYESLMLTKVAT